MSTEISSLESWLHEVESFVNETHPPVGDLVTLQAQIDQSNVIINQLNLDFSHFMGFFDEREVMVREREVMKGEGRGRERDFIHSSF